MSATEPRVAVLLNANAKRVSQSIQGAIANVVPPSDIFLSRSTTDAQSIARQVIDRGYDTVFMGGGDGTFMGFLNEICDRVTPLRTPRFGILRLGTGNAVASVVGASRAENGRMLDDLLRARAGEINGTLKLDLIDADGLRCPFAGLGIDAHVINAYAAVKQQYGKWGEGGLGYALAVGGRTVPHYLSQRRMPEIEILNTGSTAFLLDAEGRPLGNAIEHGEVLYRGPVKIVAGGTVPNFGFDFRYFPFAGRRRGKMHLRVFWGSTLRVLANLRRTFQGTYFPAECADYFCDSVRIRASQPLPFQIGGDPKGERQELTLCMADRRVELLTFKAAA